MPPLSRFFPMVSISSMNTIQGAFSWACLNKSLTFAAPIPTNISTNSEPEIEKNGTFASPATACAKRVLPVPGGPTSKAPFGKAAPISAYLEGLCRKSTISESASFASSCPATSAKVLPVLASTYIFALLFPKVMAFGPPSFFCMYRVRSCPKITNMRIGNTQERIKVSSGDSSFGISLPYCTPASCNRLLRVSPSSILPVTKTASLPFSSWPIKAILSS